MTLPVFVLSLRNHLTPCLANRAPLLKTVSGGIGLVGLKAISRKVLKVPLASEGWPLSSRYSSADVVWPTFFCCNMFRFGVYSAGFKLLWPGCCCFKRGKNTVFASAYNLNHPTFLLFFILRRKLTYVAGRATGCRSLEGLFLFQGHSPQEALSVFFTNRCFVVVRSFLCHAF